MTGRSSVPTDFCKVTVARSKWHHYVITLDDGMTLCGYAYKAPVGFATPKPMCGRCSKAARDLRKLHADSTSDV